MGYLTEFADKKLQAITQGDLDLGALETAEDKEAAEKATKDNSDLIEKMKTYLGDRVEDVKVSARLDESPACVVSNDGGMSLQMARMMKAAGQNAPENKPIFEINIDHQLVKQLDTDMAQDIFEDWVSMLFDQAVLSDSGHLDDPAAFTQRLNRLLMK